MAPQVLGLLSRELEHKIILWKSITVSSDSPIELLGWNSVQSGKIAIEHNLAAPDEMDLAFDLDGGHGG